MKKIIVCGNRSFNNYEYMDTILKQYINDNMIIVSGCARGADSLAIKWANNNNCKVEKHPAKWTDLDAEPHYVCQNERGLYNALAGMNRNNEMLQSVLNNYDGGSVIAFWDEKSKGTGHMVEIAKEAGVKVAIFNIHHFL